VEPKPNGVVSEQALQLYDLLRDEPVFVDWYLTTFRQDFNRWARKDLPVGALWSRWGVNLAIAWGLALTGVGILYTLPVTLYILLKFNSDQSRYKAWRQRVDALVNLLGLSEGLALVERAPKVGGFQQFWQYISDVGNKGAKAYGSGHHHRT
jgi:hypothetical protein